MVTNHHKDYIKILTSRGPEPNKSYKNKKCNLVGAYAMRGVNIQNFRLLDTKDKAGQ
jgi:hypothetical protein